MLKEASGIPEEVIKKFDTDTAAVELQKRLFAFLGAGDQNRGRDKWVEKGYPDLFYKLLDEDPEFAKQVMLGHSVPVMERLEKEIDDFYQDSEDKKENYDQILVADLRALQKRKLRAALTLGLGLSAATVVSLEKYVREEPPDNNEAAFTLDYNSLRELDPEAIPERVETILLDTLPKNFVVGEISSISFVNEVRTPDPGRRLSDDCETLATAEGGHGDAGTKIIFWRGMKERTRAVKMWNVEVLSVRRSLNTSSESIWNGTLLHEIAHANDWVRDGKISEEERSQLKEAVQARVQAEDRYISEYVEAISNDDAEKELEIKSEEYWAEIVEAYLKGDENLPAADAELVKAYIAKQDPNFDRDKALQERLAIIQAMDAEQAYKQLESEFNALSPLMRDRYQVWLKNHQVDAAKAVDQTMQQQGRKELVDFLHSNLTDAERDLVFKYISFCRDREILLASFNPSIIAAEELKKIMPTPDKALKSLVFGAKLIEGKAGSFKNSEPEKLLAAVDQIIDKYDLDLGSFRAGKISADEDKKLLDDPVARWLLQTSDWRGDSVERMYGHDSLSVMLELENK